MASYGVTDIVWPRGPEDSPSSAAERVQVGARTMREYGAIRLSATGRPAAAACSGSRHRPASRGQVILDDLAHHHLARVAFPSGPRPRWCGRGPARHRCRPPPGCGRPEHTPGRTSPPGGAGGQAGRRAVQPAAHGGLLAGKLAPGVRADAGQGRQRISPCCHADAGSWAPIRSGHCSSTWRGRRRGRGARGCPAAGCARSRWTGPRQTCRTARRTPGSGRPADQSRDGAFGRPGGRRRQSPGPAAGADISSGGSRHAGAPTSRTAKR